MTINDLPGFYLHNEISLQLDYFDEGAKLIAHCLNFDKHFVGGKI